MDVLTYQRSIIRGKSMNQQQPYALISVTDKSGIVEFARELVLLGYHLLSTGGTAKVLKEAGLKVEDVSTWTASEEFLGGRVKTLHPKVFGSILYDRNNQDHLNDAKRMNLADLRIVCVNLYDFEKHTQGSMTQGSMTQDAFELIEDIDIGGVSLLRASAKNFESVLVVHRPNDYPKVIEHIRSKDVATSWQSSNAVSFRQVMAVEAFRTTSQYDSLIAKTLNASMQKNEALDSTGAELPSVLSPQKLRYGENPQQKGWFLPLSQSCGLSKAQILQGKELSYNNLLDLDAALRIVREFPSDSHATVAIIKHTNPCGVASLSYSPSQNDLMAQTFSRALASDPKCAFGGIVACSHPVDRLAASLMAEIFFECIVAPGFSAEAKEILSKKKNLRLLEIEVYSKQHETVEFRSVFGGLLAQTGDIEPINAKMWKIDEEQSSRLKQANRSLPMVLTDLEFAMRIARHVKSNAIVLAKDQQLIGVGAGQMSRIDACQISISKAKELGHSPVGAVAASDAFFPFRDNVDVLAKAGISAIVQPGGSLRDEESLVASKEHQVCMIMTNSRHFKH